MYNDLKRTLEFITQKQTVKFSYLFKNLPLDLSVLDKEQMKTFLIDEGIVQNITGEGNEFGFEAEYSLSTYGKSFYKEIVDFEDLDKILYLLSDNKNKSYLTIQEVCKQINVPYSRKQELRLIGERMVDFTETKEGKVFEISIYGQNHLFVNGGYRKVLETFIEESIREFKIEKNMKENKEHPVHHHKHIHTENYFENKDSTILNQGTINKATKSEPKKNSFLQNLYWIIGIIGVLATLYGVIKNFI